MKSKNIFQLVSFNERGISKNIIHDSPFFKIINFNFISGQIMPIHSHEVEGELSILVLEGEGEFLGKDGYYLPIKKGETIISEIREPHGLKATTELIVVVTIAPPI